MSVPLYIVVCSGSLRNILRNPVYLFFSGSLRDFESSLLFVEFSQAKQIQWFLPWGHGSVRCQTKCFLRLAMCTQQVTVACKSHFTKCQKSIPLQSEGKRGINILLCCFYLVFSFYYTTRKCSYMKQETILSLWWSHMIQASQLEKN